MYGIEWNRREEKRIERKGMERDWDNASLKSAGMSTTRTYKNIRNKRRKGNSRGHMSFSVTCLLKCKAHHSCHWGGNLEPILTGKVNWSVQILQLPGSGERWRDEANCWPCVQINRSLKATGEDYAWPAWPLSYDITLLGKVIWQSSTSADRKYVQSYVKNMTKVWPMLYVQSGVHVTELAFVTVAPFARVLESGICVFVVSIIGLFRLTFSSSVVRPELNSSLCNLILLSMVVSLHTMPVNTTRVLCSKWCSCEWIGFRHFSTVRSRPQFHWQYLYLTIDVS